jgi:hypothetical protein
MRPSGCIVIAEAPMSKEGTPVTSVPLPFHEVSRLSLACAEVAAPAHNAAMENRKARVSGIVILAARDGAAGPYGKGGR